MSILRAGECLEPALCEVYKDAVIGKILIQTNDQTGEPEVSYIILTNTKIIRLYNNLLTLKASLFEIAKWYKELYCTSNGRDVSNRCGSNDGHSSPSRSLCSRAEYIPHISADGWTRYCYILPVCWITIGNYPPIYLIYTFIFNYRNTKLYIR